MKNIKYLILLLFTIVLNNFNNFFAQEGINHLLKEYENASLERKMELFFVFFQKFDVEQRDSVLYYVNDLQREGIEKGNEAAIALSNYGIVPYLQNNSLFEEAKEKLEKAEKYYFRVENDTMLSDIYNCHGNSSYLQGNFSEAEWYYQKSAEFAKSADEKRFELLSTFNLSKIYTHQGKYQEAKEMIQEYIDYMLNDNNVERLAPAYGIMGQIYLNQEKHTEAIDYFTRSMESGLAAGSMQSVANGYTNLGIAEFFSGDKDKSEQYFQLALAYRMKEGKKYYIAEGYFNLGDFYFGTHKYDSALVNYHRSLEVAKQSHNLEGQKDALLQLSTLHDTLSQHEQQVEVLKELIKVQEKLTKQQSYEEINALKMSFEQSRKEAINTGGIREDQLEGRIVEYQTVFNSWMWITLICLIALMVFIVVFKRLSKSHK